MNDSLPSPRPSGALPSPSPSPSGANTNTSGALPSPSPSGANTSPSGANTSPSPSPNGANTSPSTTGANMNVDVNANADVNATVDVNVSAATSHAADASFPVTLSEALLDSKTLHQLLFDVENAATLIGISIKSKPTENAENAAIPLAQIAEAILAKRILGVQIRYLHQGREWWDTLLCVPDGTRLVRIEHSAS